MADSSYFINPYNFIGTDFERVPERKQAPRHRGGKSGVLHCELYTKAPLSIPDVAGSDLSKKHKEYDFLRTSDGYPMIPGSSIRGPIRSMYEAVTNSCFSTTDETQSVTYRTRKPFEPGLLYKDADGVMHLYRAKRYIFGVRGGSYSRYDKETKLAFIDYEDLASYAYGQKVFVSGVRDENDKEAVFKTRRGHQTKNAFIEKIRKEPDADLQEGYICIGEPFNKRKHFESVFVKKEELEIPTTESGKSMLEKPIKDLNEIIKLYNDDKLNANAKGKKFYKNRNYKAIKEDTYYPIWYRLMKDGETIKNVHLSVANIGRAAYTKDMGDMLSDHKACEDRSRVCPACSLFGMIGKESTGSRVRFSDAVMEQKPAKSQKVILKELSSPKPSYLPFYLRAKDGKYDADISYDNNAYTLRGRKFYWHNTAKEAYLEPNGERTERNASVELVSARQKFSFSVYYDHLSETELENLIWVLTLGENDQSGNQCHKIGHGKPIGLGSVKIIVRSVDERVFENGEYRVDHQENLNVKTPVYANGDVLKQIQEITGLNACTYCVDYPGVVDKDGIKYYDGTNEHASHQWFTNNFSLGNPPKQALPRIGGQNNEKLALRWMSEEQGGSAPYATGKKTGNQTGKGFVYKKDVLYTGQVSGYNEQKTVAFIKLDNGGKAALYYKDIHASWGHIDRILRQEQKVVLSYLGKDQGKYDKWKLEKEGN